jgi:hypothetical protein
MQAADTPAASAKLPSATGTVSRTTQLLPVLAAAAATSRPWPSGGRAELTPTAAAAACTILLARVLPVQASMEWFGVAAAA